VVTTRKLDDPRFYLLKQDGSKNLYELDRFLRLPRAYIVSGIVPAASRAVALNLVKDVNLRTTAVVENPSGPLLNLDRRDDPKSYDQSVHVPDDLSSAASTARIAEAGASIVVVDVHLSAPGLLVLDDVDYPGWNATVDGNAAPVFRTNGIVRSVYVPAGAHKVQFTFNPPGLALGSWVTGQATVVLRDLILLEIVLRILWYGGRAGARLVKLWHNRATWQANKIPPVDARTE
jgi:hypothetical protein